MQKTRPSFVINLQVFLARSFRNGLDAQKKFSSAGIYLVVLQRATEAQSIFISTQSCIFFKILPHIFCGLDII